MIYNYTYRQSNQKINKIKTLYFNLIFVTLATITACGGSDETPDLTPEEQRLLDLAGNGGVTWVATSIAFDSAAPQTDLTILHLPLLDQPHLKLIARLGEHLYLGPMVLGISIMET